MSPWYWWLRALQEQFYYDVYTNICKHTHMYLGFLVCVLCSCHPTTPLWPHVLELLRTLKQSGSKNQHWVAAALLRSLLEEGRCVASFVSSELYKTSISIKSIKCIGAIWWLFFQVPLFPPLPWSCLSSLYLFNFFPVQWQCYDSTEQGECGFGGVWKSKCSFLSHCFPLSQGSGGVFLTAAFMAGLLQHAWTAPACQINRTLRPSPPEFCTLASWRNFSKPCYCHFSFDVQSWAGVWAPVSFLQPRARQIMLSEHEMNIHVTLLIFR